VTIDWEYRGSGVWYYSHNEPAAGRTALWTITVDAAGHFSLKRHGESGPRGFRRTLPACRKFARTVIGSEAGS